MGLKLAVIASSALALAAATPADYVASRQQADGGFAEPGARSDSALTAWAVLGLKAAGRPPDGTVVYLRDAPVADTTDLALRVMALRAVGESPEPFLTRLRRQRRSDGRIGSLVNSTIWGVLALPRGEQRAVRYLLGRQRPSGGWSWAPNGAPDSNDTAAAIQALRWSGVRGRPIRRGLAFIRNHTARERRCRGSSPVESRTPSRRRGPSRPTSPPASSLPRLPSASSPRSGGRTAATATAGATRSRRRS